MTEPRTDQDQTPLPVREVMIRRLHLKTAYESAPAGQWWYE